MYSRNRTARIVEQANTLYVLDARETLSRLDDDSAALARAVLKLLEVPHSREQLFVALEKLVGGPVEPAKVVDDLLVFFQHSGAIHTHPSTRGLVDDTSKLRPGLRVLLGITGAVQTMHTPTLVSMLQADGHTVRVVMTAKARKFVREASLEALTHHSVIHSLWSGRADAPAPHIQLAEWADVMIIAPASASTLARIAKGSCMDPVSATAVATRAPVLLAPSMNEAMFDAPSVQRNLDQLRDDGFLIVHPMTGHEVAAGPQDRIAMGGVMAGPSEIVRILRALCASHLTRRDKLATALTAELAQWAPRYGDPRESRPWDSDTLDDGLLELVNTHCSTSTDRVLDLGCGTGLLPSTLAARGHTVVAIDGARSAIDLAAQRPNANRVQWICANALNVVVPGEFAVVHDRAFLHVLPHYAHALYAERVARWVQQNGALVLTAHCDSTSESLGTCRFTTPAIRALFKRWFTVESAQECAMQTPAGEAIAARRYVLIRNATR